MKTYAMIPINFKYDENNNLLVRRVLIEYQTKVSDTTNAHVIYYKDTRLIDVDSYFLDKNNSHQYTFDDDGYTLVDVLNDNCYTQDIYATKREYHSFDLKDSKYQAILFIAKDDSVARKKFHEREEFR